MVKCGKEFLKFLDETGEFWRKREDFEKKISEVTFKYPLEEGKEPNPEVKKVQEEWNKAESEFFKKLENLADEFIKCECKT